MLDLSYFTDKDFVQAMKTIEDRHEADKKRITELEKKLADYRKDEEIAILQNRLEKVFRNSLMNMSDAEYEANKEFKHEHWLKHSCGNTYRYELQGTGIGTIITITCPICGESKDITDSDSW